MHFASCPILPCQWNHAKPCKELVLRQLHGKTWSWESLIWHLDVDHQICGYFRHATPQPAPVWIITMVSEGRSTGNAWS